MGYGCSSSGTGGDDGPEFDSGAMQSGDTFVFTFKDEGSYDYYCENHAPDMTGTITVSASVNVSGRDTVVMENRRFVPSGLTVSPNTAIVWINREDPDVQPHTVTSGEPPQGGGGGY